MVVIDACAVYCGDYCLYGFAFVLVPVMLLLWLVVLYGVLLCLWLVWVIIVVC